MKYQELVNVYQALESTTKRLEKTHILSEFLKTAEPLDRVVLLLQGRVFPNWDQRELGMAIKLALKAISVATGASLQEIDNKWRTTGDIGTVAEELVKKKTQSTLFGKVLSVKKVFDNIQSIAGMEGEGTVDRKVQLVAELLTSGNPIEAKYIVRTILGDLRIGLGDGTIRDAIVWAFFGEQAGIKYDVKTNEVEGDAKEFQLLVQSAFDVINDFGEIAVRAKKGKNALSEVPLELGRPLKSMLFQKATGVVEGFEIVGKPAAIEYKYDGFRLQVHKKGSRVMLFTRRLENVTIQFPDVVLQVKENILVKDVIFDAEIVGVDVKTKKYLPFQSISQRIKRKYDIEEIAMKFPVEIVLFDVLFCSGESLLDSPFVERRKVIENMCRSISGKINPAKEIITESVEVAQQFYQDSLSAGNEGVMMKNLSGIYKPGSRVGFGVKVKPTMDTLEVVIIGAEWGEGKRGKWLSSFIVAIRNTDTDEFVELGRVGTGIKEKVAEGVSFDQLTKLLEPLIVEDKGRQVRVRPEIVIEVDYEEIQKSPTYSSGFALRFPRLVRLREDRKAGEVNTLKDVQELAQNQRGRNIY